MFATIGSIFDQTVLKYPKKEALVDVKTGRRWTYEEWKEDVYRLGQAFLQAGVKKGDRVSTFLFNTSELATTLFACAKIGAVFNPINFRLQPQEVAYIIQDAQPKILLFEKELSPIIEQLAKQFPEVQFWSIDHQPLFSFSMAEKLQDVSSELPPIEVNENDLYAIMYTSGTTGRPKGVIHCHRAIAEQSLICGTALKMSPKDKGLVMAPMFHCAELHCCFIPRVHIGATNVIMHQFNPKKALKIIDKEEITVFFGAPTMWNMILQEDLSAYKRSSLRIGLYGAAPMAPVLVKKVKDELGIDLIQAYGQTEMGPAVACLLEDEQLLKPGSAGKACLNHEIRIVAPRDGGLSQPDDTMPPGVVGEIIVKGPCMMVGYYNREEETAQSLYKGWYYSGDLGYMDEDGYLFVADRVDDMVISGGENIYPREVEDILYGHPKVLDVAVIGQPHEKWGEQIIAVIVKKDESLTVEELDAHCKHSEELANYKRPRQYYFVDALPRNASGKIQKFLLKEQFAKNS